MGSSGGCGPTPRPALSPLTASPIMPTDLEESPSTLEGAGLAATIIVLVLAAVLLLAATPFFV